jgi:hypothetical protein
MNNSTNSSRTGLLNELLANNSAYASGFDKPMCLGVKKKVGASADRPTSERQYELTSTRAVGGPHYMGGIHKHCPTAGWKGAYDFEAKLELVLMMMCTTLCVRCWMGI